MNTSRRGFLGSMMAAGAVPAFSGAAAAAEGVNDLKLGVATYSLREFSRAHAIRMIKQLNTPYVSIKEFHLLINNNPEDYRRGRNEFERAGLTILSGGNVSFQKNDEDDIRMRFEYAKQTGIPMIVCAPTHETLPKMEKYVKQYDIKIAIHNHGPEDKHFPTPQSVLDAVKNMDPRFGLCMDIGHTARTGTDIVEAARIAGPRLLDVHVKDLKTPTQKSVQVPVGEGDLAIVPLFAQLKKMNYQGGVMLEYEIEGDNPLPGMQKSFSYMRGVLAGLAHKG
jgi:sugar phosphate isomerase/epimerase